MSHNTDFDRRRFIGAALAAFAVPELAASRSGSAQSGSGTAVATTHGTTRTSESLGTLRQVAAGVLNVGYADAGPANGRPVVLLHGWPYDIHSFVDVVPLLASAGHRVLVPYLRGYGTTSFLSSDTFRNGQQAALALDVIALMDALGIDKAVVAGFDWGARTANIMAVLWPERCKARRRPNTPGGTSTTSPRNGASVGTPKTDATSASSFGASRPRIGSSTRRHSTAPHGPSTIPITSGS